MEKYHHPQAEVEREVAENNLISSIISWVREQFRGQRLRDRLIVLIFFSSLIHIYVVIEMPHNGLAPLLNGFFLGLLISFPLGILVRDDIAIRIRGNLYYEPSDSMVKWFARVGLFSLALYIFYELNLPDKLFYQYFAVPVTLAYPITQLITLIWLIRHESKNGVVYIKKERVA